MSGSASKHWVAPDWRARHPDIQHTVYTWLQRASDEVLAEETERVAECEDLRPQLGRIDRPVYLRVGELDRATPADHSAQIEQELPHATLDVVPRVGHLLMQEDLGGTARAILDFLDLIPRTKRGREEP